VGALIVSRSSFAVPARSEVGKSHLMRTWATQRFSRVVELNFERDPRFANAFSANDPRVTIRRLEALTNTPLAEWRATTRTSVFEPSAQA
jgi:hypothetical protein